MKNVNVQIIIKVRTRVTLAGWRGVSLKGQASGALTSFYFSAWMFILEQSIKLYIYIAYTFIKMNYFHQKSFFKYKNF